MSVSGLSGGRGGCICRNNRGGGGRHLNTRPEREWLKARVSVIVIFHRSFVACEREGGIQGFVGVGM